MSEASYNKLFGTAGGMAGGMPTIEYVKRSLIWEVPFDGVLSVLLVAGHGGGAAAANGKLATGAGAGECAMKWGIPVKQGDSYAVTIGAGGTGGSATTTLSAAGGNGGASSFVGPNANITVNPGGGGKVGTSVPVDGGAGGTGGTGGDVHFSGGRGGNISAAANTGSGPTGGGGVNLRYPSGGTTATRGGDKLGSSINPTGGGGVGGRGGDQTSNATSTGGGGYGGNALDNPTEIQGAAGPNALGYVGVASGTSPTSVVPALAVWGLDVFGGGNSAGATTPAPGGGGGAGVTPVSAGSISLLMGGPGGVSVYTESSANSVAGRCCPGQSIKATISVAVSASAGDSGMCVLILTRT